MRIGYNPHKDKEITHTNYLHQIVIPVYIPNFDGYFKDSFQILKMCINSVLNSTHKKTFITIINNGSCATIQKYLDDLFEKKLIHEVIHTENIGKLNAILKGISGNNIPYVTISDSDVLFTNDWQFETMKVFNAFKKAGVVGTTPQFKMYETNCGNIMCDNFFFKKIEFSKVESPNELEKFYESIGWDKNYNQNYLKYHLTIQNNKAKAVIGSGHFVATYRKEIFTNIPTFMGYKMGGISEAFLDEIPLKFGLWRLTTPKNHTFHMGNVAEDWMEIVKNTTNENFNYEVYQQKYLIKKISKVEYFIKNKVISKLLLKSFKRLFFIYFKLPKAMRNKY